jgi:putative flippase GtrA
MKSPLAHQPDVATEAGPGPVASFLRFAVLGGGVGLLSSLAVPLLAVSMPWALANAVVTVVSTLLCTELHARFTFARGHGAGWREHWQSAGSATATYLATGIAVWVLHLLQPSPGPLTEQLVYLSASGLAGAGRFLVLRCYVFAPRRSWPEVISPLDVRLRTGLALPPHPAL